MGKVIGIDLGTTNSCVAVYDGGEAKVIVNEGGSRTTPSIVAFTTAGERLVGETAKRQQVTNINRTISSIKREMGTNWKTTIDGKTYNPQIISAFILQQLKKDAELYLNEEVSDAVITVPAYFNDMQRQATKDAGKIAGLNVLRIVNEPTSAALSYGLNHGEPQKVLVYDLGGGTFDVSVIEIGEGVIEVLATAGDNHLGGDDFDEVLTSYILQEYKNSNKIDLRKDPAALQRVKEAAEQAKKELSTTEKTQVMLPYIAFNNGQPTHLEMSITRATFDNLTKHLVDKTAGPVRQALSDAGISSRELARVLLVGGSTRIPAVQRKVKELTGQEPSKSVNPDECVAMGAAILGDTLNVTTDVMTKNDILLLDVTPLSLSIETVGGVATRIIERNTTLPIHYSQVFTTARSFQSSVEINVLQGERPMAKDNKSIGKFKLKGIQKAMAGVPQIEVTFDIDANGILKVSAKDLNTQKEQSITINDSERMSDEEIEQAMNDAISYASQDDIRKEAIELRNEASSLVNKTLLYLKENNKELDRQTKKELKKACSDVEKILNKFKLEKVDNDQILILKDTVKNLEEVRNDHFII